MRELSVIGILAGILTFVYGQWEASQRERMLQRQIESLQVELQQQERDFNSYRHGVKDAN